MNPKVLSPEAWKVVRHLVSSRLLETWTLAGGTGLALQFGHRYSEDLDFFRTEEFETDQLINQLAELGELSIQSRSSRTLHAVVGDLRVSFLGMEAPLVYPAIPYRGLILADPRDIAVMKVVAIGGRGSRKDFIDLYFFLQAGGSLESTFHLIHRRFPRVDYNEYHLLKSLVYFADAEAEPMPTMIREASWSDIKSSVTAEVKKLSA